ncbi:MAG: nuclease [Hydrogenophilales bacterium 17-64-11]|nr:MAG: nuclease [Hydrogenophilales bacterium 17-64-11]
MKNVITFLAAALLSNSAVADVIHGRVVGVSDGDTITVLDANHQQHRIRLTGIDAPEKKQEFGNVSKQALSGMVFGKEVSVNFAKRDRYGRVLGRVSAPGVQDVNLAQISAGMAWHYKRYAGDQPAAERAAYAAAERLAQAKGRGLWADKSPTPPWDFRRAGAVAFR